MEWLRRTTAPHRVAPESAPTSHMRITPELLVAAAALAISLVALIVSWGQLQTMQRDLTLSHRAWVTITGAAYEDFQVGQPPRVILKLKNHGATPALNVSPATSAFLRQGTPPPHADSISGARSALTIGPDQEMTVQATVDESIPNQAVIEAFDQGRVTLYARGFLLYTDVFGQEHRTRFCFQASGPRVFGNAMGGCEFGQNTLD